MKKNFEEIFELAYSQTKKQILKECLKWFWEVVLCGDYTMEFWTRE